MANKILKFPPWGKKLQARLNSGTKLTNDILIFAGYFAWEKAKAFEQQQQAVLVLPTDSSPYKFFWPVKDYPVLVFATSAMEPLILLQLAQTLLHHQAQIVRIAGNGSLVVFRR